MIITNREEVIDKAFGVFVRMNYEKASIITLAKACGVTKTGIVYYFPHKLDLFMAVADKYVLKMHEPGNKFATPADTLAEFIGQYVAGVAASMKRIVELIGDNGDPHDCSSSFYYFHFLSQVRTYYPGIRQKIERVFSHDHDLWAKVVQKAKESGEIRSDTVFYTLMGNNYRDLGAMAEAESAYRKAFVMLPGRMYPLYRLMKLYEADGQMQKAEEVARKIIAFRPKVDSPAVREMKNEAKKLTKR